MFLTIFIKVLISFATAIMWIVSLPLALVTGTHVVTIASIPVVGYYAAVALGLAMGYWNLFMDAVPYFHLPWNILLHFIIPFELGIIVLKFVLGSHIPVAHEE